jgi:hypothetical protein
LDGEDGVEWSEMELGDDDDDGRSRVVIVVRV